MTIILESITNEYEKISRRDSDTTTVVTTVTNLPCIKQSKQQQQQKREKISVTHTHAHSKSIGKEMKEEEKKLLKKKSCSS